MLRQRISYICTTLFCVDDLMKPHDSVWVARRWCDLRTDPIRRCFDETEGLNNMYLPSGHDPRVHELANSLRLGTAMLN
jgi:hypothetical protein